MKAEKLRDKHPQAGEFVSLMKEIFPHTLVAEGQAIRWLLVINPKAGGFSIRSRWLKHRAILHDYVQKAKANPLRVDCGPWGHSPHDDGVLLTAGPGDAGKAVAEWTDAEERGKEKAPFCLIVTAGGDGTSLEVLSALYRAPENVRERFAVLRLPLGTGNDGA
ncbi:MAG: acylglycerol kinase family protein, partial [Treponema sp.]|nr:acylglycerol kinase family protein [Treponema sp.]